MSNHGSGEMINAYAIRTDGQTDHLQLLLAISFHSNVNPDEGRTTCKMDVGQTDGRLWYDGHKSDGSTTKI